MADFNAVLTPGDVDNGLITTVVEIPQGSRLKIEWDREAKVFRLDRVEPSIFAKPVSYGFIPGTIDEDGDELDTLVVCSEPIPTGVVVDARIIGVLKFEDDGEVDDKIICVPADDRHNGDAIKTLDDIAQLTKQLEHHFAHYKDLKKLGSTIVKGFGDIEEAKSIIHSCIERYAQK